MEDYEKITIAEYELTAEQYRFGTLDHDVSQNRDALIKAIPKNPGKILDLGCGPGRDLLAFKKAGHTVIGLDATTAFVEMAKEYSGCEVWNQSFFNLNIPPQTFDGIFANASLIHVPRSLMIKVLQDLHTSLVDKGAILMSMCRGNGEGYSVRSTGYRYVAGWEYETLAPCLKSAGFQIIEHYYRPSGLPCESQNWLVVVACKVS
jgi:SAM-dependent methyltransferase